MNGLEKYMLTSDNVDRISSKIMVATKEIKVKNPPLKKPDPYFIPEQKDTLFWCFYIIKNGFSAFEYPGATSFSNEKAEKFKYIELLRLRKQELKTNKIKNLKEHVEDELANREKIGMKTFIALCIVSGINVLFIHKRKCFELVVSEDDFHVVHMLDAGKYSYESEITKERVEYYRNEFFKWESLDKPLKGMSSYKSCELVDLCSKLELGGDELNKKTKKELYEMIIMNI